MNTFKTMSGSEIASSLRLNYYGSEVRVKDICSAKSLKPYALTFAKNESLLRKIFDGEVRPIVVITNQDSYSTLGADRIRDIGYIISARPRLTFIRAMNLLLNLPSERIGTAFIHPSAVIEKDVKIGEGTYISAFTYIGANTKIGNNVVVYPCVSIYGNSSIGDNVIIHSGAVIGKPGFGFEKDEDGRWVMFPQIGKVVIEDDVEIGGNTVIDRGALEDTVIGRGTKIDNLVHVAHSVKLGWNSILVACVQTGGSDVFGEGTWIGPNSSLIQNIRIGNNCLAGVGSVIVKDVPDNTTVAGNPAVPISEFKRMRAALKTLAKEE